MVFFFKFYCEFAFSSFVFKCVPGLGFLGSGLEYAPVSCLGNCVFPGCLRGTGNLEQRGAALFSQSPDPEQCPGPVSPRALDTEPHTAPCCPVRPQAPLPRAKHPGLCISFTCGW